MVTKEINKLGTIFHFNEQGQWHREDGPAIEYPNGNKFWYINGKCHRIVGPAAVYYNGDEFYYIMGEHLSYGEWLSVKDFPLLW